MKKNIRKKAYYISFLYTLLVIRPVISFAQSTLPNRVPSSAPSDFKSLICRASTMILDFIPFILVIAVGAFLQGLIKYVKNGDNEEKRSEGAKLMVYGMLGFFFMVSIWSILGLFVHSFNIRLAIPQFNDAGGESFSSFCSSYIGG